MKVFSSTSEEPYDRHKYKVHAPNWEVLVDSYEEAQMIWYHAQGTATHIEVVDDGCSNKQEE